MALPPSCIFCSIVSGAIPCYKILETEQVLVILDAFPMAEGHTLVIPKAHSTDITELDAATGAQIVPICSRVTKALLNQPGVDGVNLVQNNRPAAGQAVMHTHFHLLPRQVNDGKIKLPASGSKLDAATADRLKAALSSALK